MPEHERARADRCGDQGVPLSTAPEPSPGDELSLEDFYDHAPVGYLSLLGDGTICRVNETFLSWTGHTRDGLLGGVRFASLLTIGGQIFYETHCLPLLLGGAEVSQVSLDLRRADGAVMPVLFAAQVHARGADGNPSLIRVTLVELSQRRLFEQQLVTRNDELSRSNEEHDTFSHAAAHDLQAPLRGIRQHVEFFLEDAAGELPAESEELLQTAVRLTGRMKVMLDDLLAYAQAGRGAWNPVPISLGEAVGEVVDLLGSRIDGSRVMVHEAVVGADAAVLRQLLLNLVANAAKYSEAPSPIEVGVCLLEEAARRSTVPPAVRKAASDAPVITITDHGIGIDPRHHDKVFDLFRQLDAKADGSGSGLAVCRAMCRSHGGDVWLASELGKGSTFFVLPST